MAEFPIEGWSDKHLFVRIAGRIYVIPSAQLEDFRNKKFEKVKSGRINEIFNKAKQTGDAAMLEVVVIAESDIEPPPRRPGGSRKSSTTGAAKQARPSQK
jgi:hypothetical protein